MPADTIEPQLATLVDEPPSGSGWSYEVKYDGYRILARIEPGSTRLISRNDKDWTSRMAPLARAITDLELGGPGWVDGEVVCFDGSGVSDFQVLQNALDGAASSLVFVAFDIPFWNGRDLRGLPLSERQQQLQQLLADIPDDSAVMLTQRLRVANGTEGAAAWTEACRLSLEGLICKKLNAHYKAGRSTTWLKLKCRPRQEFVVGGYTAPSGSRSGFGSLLVGLHQGKQLEYCGRVGTGFSNETLKSLHEELRALHTDSPPFASEVPQGRARYGHRSVGEISWVKPVLVAEVQYAGWTKDGVLRQASFVGLRQDKPASEITGERITSVNSIGASTTKIRGANNRIGGVAVSHPDRLVFRKPDITKRELVHYYESMADLIMPQLRARHIALLRCPDGTDSTCFFQKHLASPPPGIVLDEGDVVVETVQGLLGLIQRGVIELHTWGSRIPHIDKPDRITIDLDPDTELPWKSVVEGAQLTRSLIQEVGLRPFLKTTGGKGLHLVVPIKPTQSWDVVKTFSKDLASHLARLIPDRFTAKASKARRSDHVFVDYLRNGSGATAVCAYSVRARASAPVSMPIEWDALDTKHDLRLAAFNLRNAIDVAHERADPWKEYDASRKSLSARMRASLKA